MATAKREVVRSYKLKAEANSTKESTARYFHDRFVLHVNYWIGRLFFCPWINFSTKGMGKVSNLAKYRARGMVASLREQHGKTNVPYCPDLWAIGKVRKSKKSSFDYWLAVPNLWRQRGVVNIPLKSHKALNRSLRNGWNISEQCDFKWIGQNLFVHVYVTKQVPLAKVRSLNMGADVGVNKSVTTSDGYKGKSLKTAISKAKESQKERYRQRMKFNQVQKPKANYTKTRVKQILDREAKLFVARCQKSLSNAVVESRKSLQNLSSGRLSRWARCYFANRVETLCKESSVFFLEVSPWKSSKICSSCGKEGLREKEEFACQNSNCSEYLRKTDADLNASRELRNRGRIVVERHFSTTLMCA